MGFLPPSSRQADCRCRPVSSPIRAPTSLEPVKPTLSTRPASSACSSPAKVCLPVGVDHVEHPVGSPPPRQNSSWKAAAAAAEYSAGFHTTALPHSSAGTMYQDGTATGKFPAVITATTPTGLRNVNSCLSGISLGTVWPYSRRPSPRKKSQVSMISCTSPSASGYGLPISRVTRRASASLLASTSRPMCAIARPRTGAGTSAHAALRVPAPPGRPSTSSGRVAQRDVGDHLVEVRRVGRAEPPGRARRPPGGRR